MYQGQQQQQNTEAKKVTITIKNKNFKERVFFCFNSMSIKREWVGETHEKYQQNTLKEIGVF